jgi:hypothetical protein
MHNGCQIVTPLPLDAPWWYACEHPERLPNDWTLWVWACEPCVLSLAAAVRLGRVRGAVVESEEFIMTMTELPVCLAKARQFRAEHGLSYV